MLPEAAFMQPIRLEVTITPIWHSPVAGRRDDASGKSAFASIPRTGFGRRAPGVESRLNVCGGEPCIAGMRIPVWVLEQARRLGASEARLLLDYPTLRVEDLASAWEYARVRTAEIDRQIQENETA